MVDGVEESMKDSGYELVAREGKSQGGWILLDYNDIVVHIFDQEMREFYNLDNSWRDVERKTYLD
jgi:ribosome-associated protein